MSPGIRLVAAASSLILPNGLPAAAGPGLRSERPTPKQPAVAPQNKAKKNAAPDIPEAALGER